MKTISCVLQAETGEGESCPGVLQPLPQRYLHTQTPQTYPGPVIQASGSWSDPTSSKYERSDTYHHRPSATSTKGSPTHTATFTSFWNASTLSSSSSTCSGFALSSTTCRDYPAQPSPVMGGLLGRRCVLSDRSYQTIKTVQSVQPVKGHPVWALVSVTAGAWCSSTDKVKIMHTCDYLHVHDLFVMQQFIDLLTSGWPPRCTFLQWKDCLFEKTTKIKFWLRDILVCVKWVDHLPPI